MRFNSILLAGNHIVLEMMQESHRQELYLAAQNELIWEFHADKAFGECFHSWFDKALAKYKTAEQLPFVIRRLSNNKLIGGTRFYDIKKHYAKLSIGNTWLVPEVWGSNVNTESKYLLLNYAFETWEMNRVEFTTDVRNMRSRTALKKIGAVEEGILRSHMTLPNGYIRDSVIFSIIKPEWSQIKLRLEQKLCKSV